MLNNRVLTSAPYGTHITPLIAAVLATKGNVIEFGMGDYSTPLLHEIIKHQRKQGSTRRLISVESDLDWAYNFRDLKTSWHALLHVHNWREFEFTDDISVVFIDHAPAFRRVIDLHKYADKSEIIVVHDTDKPNYYGYEPLLSAFKSRFDYKRYRKRTTLVSNFFDVTKIL